jgi:hypothetical protein
MEFIETHHPTETERAEILREIARVSEETINSYENALTHYFAKNNIPFENIKSFETSNNDQSGKVRTLAEFVINQSGRLEARLELTIQDKVTYFNEKTPIGKLYKKPELAQPQPGTIEGSATTQYDPSWRQGKSENLTYVECDRHGNPTFPKDPNADPREAK